mmetsp:Transcript_56389/g.114898  ORF Transcript_56389/g.114898 Transcript_56389/m.114898 type:complete len:228 (+) Transcript_56389:1230-1913(+)
MSTRAPPCSWRMRASTLARPSMAMVGSEDSPRASTRTASAVLAARTREILPLFLGLAWPTRLAWYSRPYLGVSCLVLRARNSAFSAPRIWTVLAGCFARLSRLPACAMRRAPTSSPTITVRFGAMAFMRCWRYSNSLARYSDRLITWSASWLMFSRSTSLMSVPMEMTAVSLRLASTSSGRMSDRSVAAQAWRMPIFMITCAYCRLSLMTLAISGKCQPYHSFTRIA